MADRLMPSRLAILQHALGLDRYGQGKPHRRAYVTGPGSLDYGICRELEEAGLMQFQGVWKLAAGDHVFTVTDAGLQAVREHSPKPPKLTRSQRRYREWLGSIYAESGVRFGDWLKYRNRWEAGYVP